MISGLCLFQDLLPMPVARAGMPVARAGNIDLKSISNRYRYSLLFGYRM